MFNCHLSYYINFNYDNLLFFFYLPKQFQNPTPLNLALFKILVSISSFFLMPQFSRYFCNKQMSLVSFLLFIYSFFFGFLYPKTNKRQILLFSWKKNYVGFLYLSFCFKKTLFFATSFRVFNICHVMLQIIVTHVSWLQRIVQTYATSSLQLF